jgi:regulation of enolase protein 1 (concanavalin A-like superfamily)
VLSTPNLACATVVCDVPFWADCNNELQTLHPQYHAWYGDQEAIRNVVHTNRYPTAQMRESIYACLPERAGREVKFIHFKGPKRKIAMIDYAQRQGLLARQQ